jgi:hypothetical protein
MKTKIFIVLLAILGWQAGAQIYDTNGDYVQTFAGSGFSGYVDGVGVNTMFGYPNFIFADSHGNLFVLDGGRIRKITADGTVTTFAGGGNQTTGIGTNVSLMLGNYGLAMTIDHNDTIWILAGVNILGEPNLYLSKITSGAVITYTNLSLISRAQGICADSVGNIYISCGNQIFRYATNGNLNVFAGSGNSGYADGNGIFTSFYYPETLSCDQANNVYVWDSGNYLIRKIDQNTNVTTFAGTYQDQGANTDGVGISASFAAGSVYQMCSDNSGNLYLACGNCIRKIYATTNVVTLAGSFTQTGYTNGVGNLARFSSAYGVCVLGGTVYVADASNYRIRDITNNPTAQIVSPANLQLGTYPGLQITGIVGRTYQIQTSPDLNSWSTKATILLNSSPYLWIDQNPVSANKFYRALLLP